MEIRKEAAGAMKSSDACHTDTLSALTKVKHEDVSELLDHFIVRAMSPQDTPDKVRGNLDNALQTLASLMRECPTLPADPQDPTRHLAHSKSSDCALKLPQSHCAFRGCS